MDEIERDLEFTSYGQERNLQSYNSLIYAYSNITQLFANLFADLDRNGYVNQFPREVMK